MPLRRAFLLGAATIVSVAALVAVVTILSGSFGDTEGKILLGETLAPILERYSATQERPEERVLGEVDGVEVLAVRRGGPRFVRIGETTVELAADESVVVRERA